MIRFLFMLAINAIKFCLAGYDADYLFDWTILKYQEIQQIKEQNESIVRDSFAFSFKFFSS